MKTHPESARAGANVRILAAEASDAAAVARLIRQLAGEIASTSPVTASYVRSYLGTEGCRILLARQGRRVAGLISCSFRPGLFHAAPSCVVEDLIVARGSRGEGIGGRLLAEVIRIARQEKCAEISVTTEKTNMGAIRLYRRYGLVDEALFLEKHFPRGRTGGAGETRRTPGGRGSHRQAPGSRGARQQGRPKKGQRRVRDT